MVVIRVVAAALEMRVSNLTPIARQAQLDVVDVVVRVVVAWSKPRSTRFTTQKDY